MKKLLSSAVLAAVDNTTPKPETNPRTKGFPASTAMATCDCSNGFIVQTRVQGTTMKKRPASRQ